MFEWHRYFCLTGPVSACFKSTVTEPYLAVFKMSTIHPTDEQWRMYLALIEQQKLDAVRAQKEATDTLVKQIEAERKQNQEVQAGLLEKIAELVDATSTEDNGGGEIQKTRKKIC